MDDINGHQTEMDLLLHPMELDSRFCFTSFSCWTLISSRIIMLSVSTAYIGGVLTTTSLPSAGYQVPPNSFPAQKLLEYTPTRNSTCFSPLPIPVRF